ncbi:NosD domain-containing protein [Catalinimonas sp. 4WD22]|uniref:NosD domain-containing protein n=1 Tax=Catalinimonas locisalis TaxID=3133978 RepID=UPI0031013D20
MKLSFYFLLFAGILFSTMAQATVIRVDNNPDSSADYIKLQDAINNAESGDTIYVVGSPNYYDDNRTVIRINKTLTIIGPGYFLGENEETQAVKQAAFVYRMIVGEGADGTTISGMNIGNNSSYITINNDRFDGSDGTSGPSDVRLERNVIEAIYVSNASNTLISQNYFNTNDYPIRIYQEASRTIIRNNIIVVTRNLVSIYGIDNVSLVNTVIENNTFGSGLYRVHGATIQNNIFAQGILNDCDNNNVKNNLFTTTQEAVIPENSTGNTLSSNIFGAVQANIFVNPAPSIDNEFKLASDSPAIGQGINGENLGAFGGVTPYKLSGLPPIPAIYDLDAASVGTPNEGLRVVIKVKSHN